MIEEEGRSLYGKEKLYCRRRRGKLYGRIRRREELYGRNRDISGPVQIRKDRGGDRKRHKVRQSNRTGNIKPVTC